MNKTRLKSTAVFLSIACLVTLLLNGCHLSSNNSKGGSSAQSALENEVEKPSGEINSTSLIEGVTIKTDGSIKNNPFSLRPESYNDSRAREQLKIIHELGFNAVRILTPVNIDNIDDYVNKLDSNIAVYEKFLLACKDNGLRVLPVILPPVSNHTEYQSSASAYYRLLEAFVNQIERKFSDIIIGFEICDKPDVNVSGLLTAEAKKKVEDDSFWQEVGQPFITWAGNTLNDLGTKVKISAGFQSAPRFEGFQSTGIDYIGFYAAQTTLGRVVNDVTEVVENKDTFIKNVGNMILLGVGEREKYLLPAGEIIAFCRETGAGYFLHDYLDIYRSLGQGVLDMRGRLHTSGLTYDFVSAYNIHATLKVAGTDLSYGGSGMIEDVLNDIIEAFNQGTEISLSHAAERSYNLTRCAVPYYLPEFREAVFLMRGKDNIEKFKNMIYYSMEMLLPYIRTYGSYVNDNALGGFNSKGYIEISPKVAYNPRRARYALELGKMESNGIWTESQVLLFANQMLSKENGYTLSVDLKPDSYSFAGAVFASAEKSPLGELNEGLYIKVFNQTEKGYVSVLKVDSSGFETEIKGFDFDKSLFESDGYVKLTASIKPSHSNGVYKINVSINEKPLGEVEAEIKVEKLYAGLASPEGSPAYYDNLVLYEAEAKSADKVIFSDSFEQGRVDNDFINYNSAGNAHVLEKIDEIKRLTGVLEEILLSAPTKVQVFSNNRVISLVWEDNSIGENGYEIQRSRDGLKWDTYWRTSPNATSAVIPIYADYAIAFIYRVAPVGKDNCTSLFSEQATAQLTENPSGEIIQEFTTSSGKRYSVKGQGTTVVVVEKTE